MLPSGPNSPSSSTATRFSNVTNIYTSDNTYATATISTGGWQEINHFIL